MKRESNQLLNTKLVFDQLSLIALVALLSCGNSNTETKATGEPISGNASPSSGNSEQAGGIVGEWEQQYACFDKNGNYKLEYEEKKPSGTRPGFD